MRIFQVSMMSDWKHGLIDANQQTIH